MNKYLKAFILGVVTVLFLVLLNSLLWLMGTGIPVPFVLGLSRFVDSEVGLLLMVGIFYGLLFLSGYALFELSRKLWIQNQWPLRISYLFFLIALLFSLPSVFYFIGGVVNEISFSYFRMDLTWSITLFLMGLVARVLGFAALLINLIFYKKGWLFLIFYLALGISAYFEFRWFAAISMGS